MSLEEASRFRLTFQRVQTLVKPVRDRLHRQIHEECFWKHWDRRVAFFAGLPGGPVLVSSLISKHWALAFVPNGYVYDQKVVVFAENSWQCFGIYQSIFHETWARRDGGLNIGPTPSYTVSANFNTFPPPSGYPWSESAVQVSFVQRLILAGRDYHEFRKTLMQKRGEGLTNIYNCFHNRREKSTDFAQLRSMHIEIDQAVAAAYGWTDLDLGRDFQPTKQGERYTIKETTRRTILDRVLSLNHDRHAEEQTGGAGETVSATVRRGGKKKLKAEKQTLDLLCSGGANEHAE
jgi:hypothetical protein